MSQRLLILITIALILGFGVFWLSRHKVVAPTTTKSPSTQSTQEPNQTIDTSDWKTYKNDIHKFIVSYPDNWEIKERAGENADPSVVSLVSPETKAMLQTGKTDHTCDISIYHYLSVSQEPENKTKTTSLDKMIEENHLIQYLGYSDLGGYSARKVIWGGNDAYYSLLAVTPNGLYKALFCHKEKENSLTPIEKEIIKSFEFFPIDTSDWKTYRNEEYGFEVKIPKNWEMRVVYKENGVASYFSFSEKGKWYWFEGGKENAITVTIGLKTNPYFHSTKDLLESWAKTPGMSWKEITVNGIKLYRYTGYGEGVETADTLPKDYSFSISSSLDLESYPEVKWVLDGMIQTLRFDP